MSQFINLTTSGGGGSGTVTSISAGTGITLTPNPITTTGTVALTLPVVIANGGTNATSMTNTDGVVYFDGTLLNTTTVGTAGQFLTSNGAGLAPTFQTAGTSNIVITGDTGGPLTSHSFTFTGGTTGLVFGGAGTTETLSGTLIVGNGGTGAATFTAHGVILGEGTSALGVTAVGATGQVLTGVTGSDPVWASPATSSISITGDSGGALTGAAFTFTGGTTGLTFAGSGSTETLGGDLVVANGGTGNTTFTAYSVLTAGTTATGAFQNVSGVGTTGQVLTSQGAAALPQWANAAVAFTWSVITADQNAVVNNGYICNKASLLTLTLPTTAAVGTLLEVTGMNTALGWKIAQNASQQIFFGTSTTTSGTGGSLASSAIYDSVRLVCNVANTSWIVISSVGNITYV